MEDKMMTAHKLISGLTLLIFGPLVVVSAVLILVHPIGVVPTVFLVCSEHQTCVDYSLMGVLTLSVYSLFVTFFYGVIWTNG